MSRRTHVDLRDEIFRGLEGRTVTAALVADESGIVTPVATVLEAADELGLAIEHAVEDGASVAAGEQLLRFVASAKQVALADERLIGMLAKPSGIATAAASFVARAGDRSRVVCGAWKKLPYDQKEMLRAAIWAGGADARIAEPPFVYLDKNFVTMLGGINATLAAVAHMDDHRKVVQVRDAGQACAAARGGADIVFVDTGRRADVADAVTALRAAGLRDGVQLAFGGGVQLVHLEELCALGVDIVDVGRAIVDAPLLDLHLEVLR